MKKIYILLLLLVAVGCTNNSSPSNPGQQPEQEGVGSTVVEISNLEVDGLVALPDPISLGPTTNDEKTSIVTIKNSSSSSKVLSITALSSPGFKIKLNRCAASLDAGKSCQVTVAFSPKDFYTGTYNDSLVINGASILITATVAGKPDPDTTGTPDIKLSLSAPFEPMGSSPLRVLNIKNEGTGTAQSVSTAIPSAYVIWTNRCPSVLKPQKSCEVQVMLKNARQLPPVADQSVIVVSTSQAAPVSLNLKEGASFNKSDVSGIVMAGDGKSLSISGSNLTRAVSVAMYKSDGVTLIDTMTIVSKQSNLIVVKPSQDLLLQETEFILRIL